MKKDSTKDITILIIPFNPAMYFSDADKDIADVSKIEPGKVRDKFNGNLEATIADKLMLYYDVKRLSKQKDAENDLDIIYGSISYAAEKIKKKEETEKKGMKDLRRKIDGSDKTMNDKDAEMYMNISFADNRLLDYLSKKYGVDYFIFFNQFDVKTDYENCIDLQMRQYYRELKVHYTVVDKKGKNISGAAISLPYHTNENNIETIVKENFSILSAEIFGRIYLRK